MANPIAKAYGSGTPLLVKGRLARRLRPGGGSNTADGLSTFHLWSYHDAVSIPAADSVRGTEVMWK